MNLCSFFEALIFVTPMAFQLSSYSRSSQGVNRTISASTNKRSNTFSRNACGHFAHEAVLLGWS